MAFHLQTVPKSGHSDYATFDAAMAAADEHPDDWQEIRDLDTGNRWVRADGKHWILPAAHDVRDASDANVAAASIVNQIANRD